jgi:hypothetical protein
MTPYVKLAADTLSYWQASQDLGLSSEQATAAPGEAAGPFRLVPVGTVVFAILVAGRDRR